MGSSKMGSCGSCLIFILACLSLSLPADAFPNTDHGFPHIVEVDVTDYFLFTLIQKIDSNFTDDNVRSVFRHILNRHHMTISDFNLDLSLAVLGAKLRRLWTAWTKKSSGSNHKKMIKKWEKSKYKCKIYHKTGSPTKRKLEDEVRNEQVRRKKLESDFDDVSKELRKCNEEKEELERKVERLSNPNKRKQGHRGRSKGKKKGYSKSQKRRQKKNRKCKTNFERFKWARDETL